jgi:hypothetical protein
MNPDMGVSARLDGQVYGIDYKMRKDYFGPQGDTGWNKAS